MLPQKRAYTTVETTLNRLFHKGLAKRQMIDRKFLYSARLSRQQLEKIIDRDLIARVLARPTASRESILSSLLQVLRQ